MNKQTRRKFTPESKARVTLEAQRGQLTLAELAQKFEVNSVMICRWKAECIEKMAMVFEGRSVPTEEAVDVDKLFAQIGQLKVENDFLKKVARNWGYERTAEIGLYGFSKAVDSQAVRLALRAPQRAVLSTPGGKTGECEDDEFDGSPLVDPSHGRG